MKKTLFTIALAAAMTPFTFAAQAPTKPADNPPAQTEAPAKKTVKKHKKHTKPAKSNKEATPAPTK